MMNSVHLTHLKAKNVNEMQYVASCDLQSEGAPSL